MLSAVRAALPEAVVCYAHSVDRCVGTLLGTFPLWSILFLGGSAFEIGGLERVTAAALEEAVVKNDKASAQKLSEVAHPDITTPYLTDHATDLTDCVLPPFPSRPGPCPLPSPADLTVQPTHALSRAPASAQCQADVGARVP
jgi:hypothetical protein